MRYNEIDGKVGDFFYETADGDIPGDGIDPFSMTISQTRLMQMVC
jgi:hypothetical protein